MPLQTFCKLFRIFALTALRPAHVQRSTHQQQAYIPTIRNFFQTLQIVANPRSFQRLYSLRGNSEFITNGKSDSLLPHVKRKYPSGGPFVIRVHQLRIIEREDVLE